MPLKRFGRTCHMHYALAAAALCVCGCYRGIAPEPAVCGSSLERLFQDISLERRDIGVDGVHPDNRDPFLLHNVEAFLKSPMKLVAYAEDVSSDLARTPTRLASLVAAGGGLLELDMRPNGYEKLHVVKRDPDPEINEDLRELYAALEDAAGAFERATAQLTPDELAGVRAGVEQYLFRGLHQDNIPRIISQQQLERVFQHAARIDLSAIARAGYRIAALLDELLPKLTSRADMLPPARYETPLGPVVIGSSGDDRYEGRMPLVLIDPDGNDTYRFSSIPPFHILIDLGGNDTYEAAAGAPLPGSGIGGIGFLVDMEGDDLYRGAVYAGGAGLLGAGVLADFSGNDRYAGAALCQGAGALGVGVLYDAEGNDTYQCDMYGQGFGFTGGAGLLVDAGGADAFRAGLSIPDSREPGGAFQTYAQGFGLGARLFASGGVGVLYSGGGNTTYHGSYFCQGSSYWQALGMLIDRGGNDRYTARRYSQGAGIHTSLGVLYDHSGDDVYRSWGVSQGCGHDRAVGVLRDAGGRDVYEADWLSQGAGSSGGVGMLIDDRGLDTYAGCPGPAHGPGGGVYDNRLDILSIGLLVDAAGQTGGAAQMWRKGDIGGGIFDNGTCPAVWREAADVSGRREAAVFPESRSGAEQLCLLPELESSLDTPESRQQAARSLAARGVEVLPSLLAYRRIRDVLVRRTIEDATVQLAKADLAGIHDYMWSLEGAAADLRFLLFVLGETAHRDSAPCMHAFAGSADHAVRAMALRGLYKLGVAPPSESVDISASSENRDTRRYLGLVLRYADDESSLRRLAGLLADPDMQVRRAACASLKKKSGEVAALMNMLLDTPGLYQSTYRMAAEIIGMADAAAAESP